MLYNEYLQNRKYYQLIGRDFLLEMKHACLFYKPGKGKTYPCVEAARAIDESMNGKARVLILSTADAVTKMWMSEIVPQHILPKHTSIITFTKAIQDAMRTVLLQTKFDIIIVDESHKIKSHSSKISKLVYLLTKKVPYAWALSGTPRSNNDVDIFCQFHNMNVSKWGDISYTQFVDTCCDVDKQFLRGMMIKKPIGINDKYKAGWERNIVMYTQRVDYEEDDNMPPCTIEQVSIPFKPSKEYLLAKQGVINLPDYITTLNKLSVTMKLQQLANGFMYIPHPEDETKRLTCDIQHNNKLDWLTNNLSMKPTLLVYKFEVDYEQITNHLTKIGKSWTEDIEQFKKGKHNVLILNCARCESFNLQMCANVIFYTMDYSYIMYEQMMRRVHRMGQDKPVSVKILIAEGTVENQVWGAVQNKQTLSDMFYAIKESVR